MISTSLHWIDTPTAGRLAISARPRGGDWLETEIFAWKSQGIDTIVSLLEPHEEQQLDITAEAEVANRYHLEFISFPIPDRDIPLSWAVSSAILEGLKSRLENGKSLNIHCRQGVGRAGMIAASLLALVGVEPEFAIERVSKARGVPVPETTPQREWITSALSHR